MHQNDQFKSAHLLLEKLGEIYRCIECYQLNIRALAIYIHGSIEALARTTKEVAINTTFGTNNAGMDLFALHAELDGTGVPMPYLFVEKKSLSGMASCGSLTQILDQVLRPIKELHHLAPSFVGCNKDLSEINAIQQVWLTARVQLCFWHAKRAIQKNLRDSS